MRTVCLNREVAQILNLPRLLGTLASNAREKSALTDRPIQAVHSPPQKPRPYQEHVPTEGAASPRLSSRNNRTSTGALRSDFRSTGFTAADIQGLSPASANLSLKTRDLALTRPHYARKVRIVSEWPVIRQQFGNKPIPLCDTPITPSMCTLT